MLKFKRKKAISGHVFHKINKYFPFGEPRDTYRYRKIISYDVNLVDENNKVLKNVYSNDKLIAETKVDYAYPKYLTDENGKVTYVCDANTFSGSVSPVETGTTEIKYSAYKGTAYFIEAEDVIKS